MGGELINTGAVHHRLSMLRHFFSTWVKLDLTTIAATVTIIGTITAFVRSLQSTALKFYWWFTRFCTASISVASNDRLNREIVNWIGAQVLEPQRARILTARTETIKNDAWLDQRNKMERTDHVFEKRIPIQYLPTFGVTWFIHKKNMFLVRRMPRYETWSSTPQEYASAPEGREPLVVMCIGRSVTPIKQFLETCRDFAEQQRSDYVTVRASSGEGYNRESWDTTILRPRRPLETVHLDEVTMKEIVADMRNYLDPATRRFYMARGIPYRRGFLLKGSPGTGKSSLSLALAGHLGLELYLCHLPSIQKDQGLERLFMGLPPRCLVLLEDIDAVGVSRRPENDDDDEEDDEKMDRRPKSSCTLSGLLNVLDGVASQEGRIVLMTSNYADRLDKALIRPGRIDRIIELGNISPRSAELMFLRMYTPDDTHGNSVAAPELHDGELEKLALSFSNQIPEDTFTPAQLQGLLLNNRDGPHIALAKTAAWVEDEVAKMEERKRRDREAAQRRREKRREKALAEESRETKCVSDAGVLEKVDDVLKAEQGKVTQEVGKTVEIASGTGGAEKELKVSPAKDECAQGKDNRGEDGKVQKTVAG